jgi:hypothetical protein
MVDEQLSSWLPRTTPLQSGARLPAGTRLTIRAESNKELQEVRLFDLDSQKTTTIAIGGRGEAAKRFSHPVPSLDRDLTLEVTLLDADNVTSERPHRIFIGAIEDQPPTVQVALRGIGTLVTPDVRIPARGRIGDDYGVSKAWFEVQLNDDQPTRYACEPAPDGLVQAAIDFREKRGQPDGIELKPNQRLKITVKASDNCNLAPGPHVGAGDTCQLNVVTADQLLAHLEAQELGLRQRFELLIEEMAEMRDSLVRLSSPAARGGGAEPEDVPRRAPAADAPSARDAAAPPVQSLQRARVSQAQRQSQKSAQEVLGVAAAFRDIREELINNRIDTEDRKQRLEQQIANPLQRVGDAMFPELDRRLATLDGALDNPSLKTAAADNAIQQANNILAELDKVLQRMLELETFNELVGIVRSLLENQTQLMDKTKQLRKKQAMELLR